MKLGSIPEKLKLFVRPQREVSFRWTDVEFEDGSAAKAIVSPTFVTDSTNLKTQKTAEYWAKRRDRQWDPEKRKYIELKETYYVEESDNTPRTDVRIIDLDIRGHGGRAYRAVVDGKYLVDMREDVILDAMINLGIGKNATLPGEYVFASVNSEMKLIRVGSLLHAKMVESTEFNKKKKIEVLVPGGIYQSKTKTILYLGKLWTRDLDSKFIGPGSYYWIPNAKYRYTLREPRQVHLSLELSSDKKYDKLTTLSQLNDRLGHTFYYNFSATMSKSFRECLANIDVKAALDGMRVKLLKAEKIGYTNVASLLNTSETKGYVHPAVQQFIDDNN